MQILVPFWNFIRMYMKSYKMLTLNILILNSMDKVISCIHSFWFVSLGLNLKCTVCLDKLLAKLSSRVFLLEFLFYFHTHACTLSFVILYLPKPQPEHTHTDWCIYVCMYLCIYDSRCCAQCLDALLIIQYWIEPNCMLLLLVKSHADLIL